MSPDDPVHAPSELVETVMGLLEDSNVPVPISDSIVAILERWERGSPLPSPALPAPGGEKHPNGEVRTCMKCGKRWWNDGRQFCECGGETACGVTDPPPLTPAAIDVEELYRLAFSEPEDGMGGDFVWPIDEFRSLITELRTARQSITRLEQEKASLILGGTSGALQLTEKYETRIGEMAKKILRLREALKRPPKHGWRHGLTDAEIDAVEAGKGDE